MGVIFFLILQPARYIAQNWWDPTLDQGHIRFQYTAEADAWDRKPGTCSKYSYSKGESSMTLYTCTTRNPGGGTQIIF